jgi:hypothetical protein
VGKRMERERLVGMREEGEKEKSLTLLPEINDGFSSFFFPFSFFFFFFFLLLLLLQPLHRYSKSLLFKAKANILSKPLNTEKE